MTQSGAFQTRQPQFKGTIAEQSDLRSVARLCRRAVGPTDYILKMLPNVMAHGRLFLAWYGFELVGMTNFDKCVDGSGWLSMARTDPDWRRRGVAMFLQHQIIEYARRKAIGPLRLWALSKNKASIGACDKGGFMLVCEAAHVSCRLSVKKKAKQVLPTYASDTQLQSFLRPGYSSKMNGYIARGWHFMRSSERLLRQLEKQGELYVVGDSAFLVTRPEIRFKEPQSSLTILTGPVPEAMKSARKIAGTLGAKNLSSYIPYEHYQLSIAKKCGFRRSPWGSHCFVFEKKV